MELSQYFIPKSSEAGVRSNRKRNGNILDRDYIASDLTENTCVRRCSCKCSILFNNNENIKLIQEWRTKYHTLKQGIARQMKLIELVKTTQVKKGNGIYHNIEGLLVCRPFWYKVVIKVSRSTYMRCQRSLAFPKEFLARDLGKTVGTSGYRGSIAKGFMQQYINRVGDPSPETQRVLLPACISIKSIYDEYEKLAQKEKKVNIKRFYQIWKMSFKHVSCPKSLKNQMSGCDVCMLARELISTAKDSETKQALIDDRNIHLQQQQKEREYYYEKRALAVSYPNTRASLIADGMDQSKTDLPHYKGWKLPKSAANRARLKTHITGVILHGHQTHFFLDIMQWPHDSNLVLNCILFALLCQYKEDGMLPTILNIQLDNCGRENKNKYVLGFVALLVHRGFVKEAEIGFLMTGHTHEDIDQRFSKVSHILRRRHARTIPELLTILDTSLCSTRPKVALLGHIFDIKTWIMDSLDEIHNHSHPHVFRITKEGNNAICKYKLWSTDKEWQPQIGLRVFKRNSNEEDMLPSGRPIIVQADYEKRNIYKDIKQSVEIQKMYMNFDQYSWWQRFLLHTDAVMQEVAVYPTWFLDDINIQSNTETVDEESEVVSPLSLLLEKENNCPAVYVGKRQSSSNTKANKQKTYQPCVGHMIAFRGAGAPSKPKVGKLVAVEGDILKLHLYTGPLTGKQSPHLKTNGSDHIIKVKKDKQIYIFNLTPSFKIPALALKKIREQ